MAEIIGDGIGSANLAIVDDTHRLWVAGSITSMPAITAAADPATTKVGDAGLGSASLAGAYDGVNDVQGLRIVNGSHLLIAGSISSMPTVSVTNPSVTEQGTEHLGSITYIGGESNGSVFPARMALGSFLLTAGSITSIPSISVTNPSVAEVGTEHLGSATLMGGEWNGSIFPARIDTGSYIMTTGSISSMPRIGISGTDDIGSVVISSAPLIGISGLVFTEGKIVGSFAPKGIGSVIIKSAPLLGVSGAIFDSGDITGSVVISSAPLIGVSGDKLDKLVGSVTVGRTVEVSGGIFIDGKLTGSFHPQGIGSVIIKSSSLVGVSGLIFTDGKMTGSMAMQGIGSVIIKSAPLIGVSGLVFTDGKMTGSMAMKGIGSMVISSSNLIGISGAIFDSGDITGSVVISSAPLIGVSGLIFTDGKMTGSMAMKGIGSMVISSSVKLGVSGIVEINEVIPIGATKQNPSYALVYDPADSISGIYFQTDAGSYFQGFLWDAGSNLVHISEWSTI